MLWDVTIVQETENCYTYQYTLHVKDSYKANTSVVIWRIHYFTVFQLFEEQNILLSEYSCTETLNNIMLHIPRQSVLHYSCTVHVRRRLILLNHQLYWIHFIHSAIRLECSMWSGSPGMGGTKSLLYNQFCYKDALQLVNFG